jgi:hypothetical protein
MTAGSAATVTSVAPSSDPTPSLVPVADPAGNAVVFIHGYIPQTNRIEFSYAHRAGTTGTDLFLRDSTKTYSAGIASGLTITSGTLLCPPVGSGCTIDQLTEATTTGFFADVGIDPAGDLRSVIERDNLPAGSDTNAASAAPTPTGSRAAPTASAGTAPAGGTPASATTAASPSDTASAD